RVTLLALRVQAFCITNKGWHTTVGEVETALAHVGSRSLDLDKYMEYLLEMHKAEYVLNEFYQNTMTWHYTITTSGPELFVPLYHRLHYLAYKNQKKVDVYYAAATPSKVKRIKLIFKTQATAISATQPEQKVPRIKVKLKLFADTNLQSVD
ncbi:hypothetical protein LPJ66_005144, partial [Kickxella alabastrina]